MFKGFNKIAIFTSMLIVGGVSANNLDLPMDSNGNKILSIDERVYNGKLIKSIKYMDKDGNFMGKVVDKDGKEIEPSFLVSKDKSIFGGKLKQILKAKYGDADFIFDDEVIEVIVALKHENIELDLEPSILEIKIKGDDKEIKLNGNKIDKKTLKDKEEKNIAKRDKARRVREDKMRKKIDTFAKRNGLERDSAILEAYENARSSIKLKFKKNELEKFALKNQDLIVNMELATKPKEELASAMQQTKIDPYALLFLYPNRKGDGIGVYMSEGGCPLPGYITNYTRLATSTSIHSNIVASIIRGVSPNSYIYCKDSSSYPSSTDLNGYNGNPRVYIETFSFGFPSANREYDSSDRDYDNHIYDYDVIAFKSAGNNDTNEANVTSPGKALNIITVGNFSDANDTIAYDSCYVNSTIGNEKPEIVAPGDDILTAGYTDPKDASWGTSFSSPHAAGFAADLMSAETSLQLNPHRIKAAMLAGATQSIIGGNDKVGVGGIDFYRTITNTMYNSWEGNNNDYSYIDSIDDKPNNNSIDWNVNLTAGKNVRIAISWLNRGTYTYDHRFDTYPIGMDIDLRVYDSNNNMVAYSSSWFNPYEVVDFTPSTTGVYRINLLRFANRDTNCDIKIGAAVTWE